MADQEGSIKVTLCEVITALMSQNPNERKIAEQQLEALQMIDGKKIIFFPRKYLTFHDAIDKKDLVKN